MSAVLADLVATLSLEKIEENFFRGQSQDPGWGQLYGGHVLGQALSAAVQTVPAERMVHSLHAYFLRPGAVDRPTLYAVDRIRDGRSFTTRRVVATQRGEAIFSLSGSFHKEEPGFEHQDDMPKGVPAPESLVDDRERLLRMADRLPAGVRKRIEAERPFEFRRTEDISPQLVSPSPRPPRRNMWFRAAGKLDDDPALHRYLLAYISDSSLVTTALRPHGVNWLTDGVQVASIDHAMWFHRPFRVDDWLLHVVDSPSAHGARGFARGRIFTAQGVLVASTAQEGLIRRREPR